MFTIQYRNFEAPANNFGGVMSLSNVLAIPALKIMIEYLLKQGQPFHAIITSGAEQWEMSHTD